MFIVASLALSPGQLVVAEQRVPVVVEVAAPAVLAAEPAAARPGQRRTSVTPEAAIDGLDVILFLEAAAIAAAVIVPLWLVSRAINRARAKRLPTTSSVQIDPPSVRFGIVSVGQTALRPLAVTNRGTAAIQLSAVAVSGAGFSLEGLPPTPFRLGPGEHVDVHLTFAPARTCRSSGRIEIRSGTPDDRWNVALEARAVR